MYRPYFQVYPRAAGETTPDLDIGFHHESPRVVQVDITKSWKGLSSDKAEELLFWETTFRRILECLLHDQLELLQQQCEITAQTPRGRERSHSDRIHYLPICIIDIATAMVYSYREHRRMYRWLASMGNIYKTVAQFVRTHDCFVSPAVGKNSFHTTGDLRIGVKLLGANNYLQSTAIHPSGSPVEVNWAPDMLSFEQFDPITTEGHEFRLVPRYNSSLTFTGADNVLDPRHIVYKTSATWLRWDSSISGFHGTVPFYSDSVGEMPYPEAHLIGGASREQPRICTLRIMITATALEYFDPAVRFEKTVRARVTINVMKRQCPQFNLASAYTLGLMGADNPKCNRVQSSPEWGPLQQPCPQMKWWDDPFIGAGVPVGCRADEKRMLFRPSGHYKDSDERALPSRHPFDSFTRPSLLSTNIHTGLPTLSDDWQIGKDNDISPPTPLESGLRVPPLRRQRRSPHNVDTLKTIPKLGSTVLPQMKTDHPNHPRTESGDKRLRHDIVNMLGMSLHCNQNDEDLEMRYRPWGKRSYWRGTGLSVQKKGNGYPCQGRRLPRNSMFSKTNSEDEDESYISKYCQKMRLGSDQHSKWKPEFNFSRTPSSEPLTMDCSRFLNSHMDTRGGESGMEVPWTPPPSDVCPCGFEPCRLPGPINPQTGSGAEHDVTGLPPLVRGKDKAAFVQMIVEREEEERRMLGSDIGDIFDSSPTSTSEGDWEDVDTDEDGVSIPNDEDSDEDQTNEGVPIPIHGSSIKG